MLVKLIQGQRVRHPNKQHWRIGQMVDVLVFFVGVGDRPLKLARSAPNLVITILFVCLCLMPALAQESVFRSYMQSGRNAFELGNYAEAERFYRLAIKEVGLTTSAIGNTETVSGAVVEQLLD